jgi:hypothetical protein
VIGADEHFCLDPTLCQRCRTYPLARTGPDERFSESLITSIAALLVGYGYPPVDNVNDWTDLEIALAGFLYQPRKDR